MNDIDDLLNLRDLGLVASLESLNFKAVGTRLDEETGRVYFMFLKSRELQDTIDAYWANTLTVKARQLNDTLKMLKSRIYQERQ